MKLFREAVITLFFLGLFFSSASAQKLKIGVYDSNRIFKESKTVAGYNAELSKSIEAKRAVLTQKETALRQLVEKLRKEGATMSPADRKTLEGKVLADDKELKRLREDVEQELRRVQAELRQKAFVDINQAVKQIGEKEGYSIIFDVNGSTIAYFKDTMDITGKLISQMK